MNEAILPSTRALSPPASPGVYADLASLVRLRFIARGISLLPKQPLASVLAGRHASRLRGRGLNFEEIRRYFPGDDIRQIDWKVTARTRIPHARIYTEEKGRETLLVVDQRMSLFFGSVRNFKSVTAAEVAALAAWRVIAAKDRVSALVFGDDGMDLTPGGGTRNEVMRILGTIVDRNSRLGIDRDIIPSAGMLNTALQRAEHLVKHDALVILITDASGADATTRAILSRIAAHNDVAVAFVHDPLEVDLPDSGSRVFASGGLQLETDTSDRKLREKFADDFKIRFETAKRFLIQREVPLLPVRTDEEVAPQIRRLLGTRIRK